MLLTFALHLLLNIYALFPQRLAVGQSDNIVFVYKLSLSPETATKWYGAASYLSIISLCFLFLFLHLFRDSVI